MARASHCLAVLLTGVLLAVTPAAAFGSSKDVASTKAFVSANYALGRATKARITFAEHTIGGYITQLSQQCHAAAYGSPGNTEAEQFSNEVVVVLTAMTYHADAPAIANLAHAVKGLHWSNPKVNRTIARYVARLQALAALPVPDLCTDVKTWAASGFKTVPANTLSVDKNLAAIEAGPTEISKRLLAPYLRSSDARTFSLTSKLEYKLRGIESDQGSAYWSAILETLALNP
jgi:hypothetical protein